MAIASLDTLIAALSAASAQQIFFHKTTSTGFANNLMDSFRLQSGIPAAAATAPTIYSSGGSLLSSATQGALPFTNPSGSESSYIAGAVSSALAGAVVSIYDRLWEASGISLVNATASPITFTVSPEPSLTRYTTGEGVEAFIVCTNASGSVGLTTGTVTFTYTNSSGTTGRTGTFRWPGTATSQIGQTLRSELQTGDTGIRTISNVRIPANGTNPNVSPPANTSNVFLARKILDLHVNGLNASAALDAYNTALAKVENDACLFCIIQVPALISWGSSAGLDNLGAFFGFLNIVQG